MDYYILNTPKALIASGIVGIVTAVLMLAVRAVPMELALVLGLILFLFGILRLQKFLDLLTGIPLVVAGTALLLLGIPILGHLARFFLTLSAGVLLFQSIMQIIRDLRSLKG